MKVLLLHNTTAGADKRPGADEILRAIREAGHAVTYQAADEEGAAWALLDPTDVVIVAGGDGTVRNTALALAGRNVPIAILPFGTANNIAKTLGLTSSPLGILSRLAEAKRKRFDLGLATGPWGKIPFLESSGTGLFARVISYLSNRPGAQATHEVDEALDHLKKWAASYPARVCTTKVDGREMSGRFLAIEAMNIRSAGPNIVLAPQNDPGDGLFDFVFLREESRAAFLHYLEDPADWNDRSAPVEIIRGRELCLESPEPIPFHADDCTWPHETEQKDETRNGRAPGPMSLEIHVTSVPLQVLVP